MSCSGAVKCPGCASAETARALGVFAVGEVGGFLGEVCVSDGGFAGGDVFQRDVQTVDVGAEDVFLERAQAAAEIGDLADRGGEDALGLDEVSGDQGVGATGAQGGEEAV